MRLFVTLAVLGALVVACGGQPAQPTEPSQPEGPVRAVDTQAPFQLVFSLPSTTFTAGEAIEGEAMLSLTAPGAVELGGSGGGLLGFEFREVGGRRHIEPAWMADCVPHRLADDRPIVSGITKSGGFSADDPEAAFYRAFFADPLVRLPAGEWEISAIASIVEGADCSGPAGSLRASIRVTVTP
jgi:hypothetical protein